MTANASGPPFVSSRFDNSILDRIFPADKFGRTDYILATLLIAFCFLFFFQGDLPLVGSCSLNYLFGNPLDFYENCVRLHADWVGSCPYPPSTYVLFSVWLLPFKWLGVLTGPESFPIYLTYWLKSLTTIFYFATALVFRRILLEYSSNPAWANYATVAWLVMPLGVFSQFIFSQCDIFYVLLTSSGVLMFARRRLYAASAFFGIAITFKYFPAFVFLPLLLFSEKNLSRLVANGLIFLAPTVLINIVYHTSTAYALTVNNYGEVSRVYSAVVAVGGWQIYLMFSAFMTLCGIAYVITPTEDRRLSLVAYFWLVGSILPFLFIVWHPQWLIFVTPAIVLSSMLSRTPERFMLLDLVGMFLFVAVCSIAFPTIVDAAMFRGELLGIHFEHGFLMRRLFDWFSGHSRGVFLSAFSGYLLVQLLLKGGHLFIKADMRNGIPQDNQFGNLRIYFYAGLLIFLIPASIALFEDRARNEFFVTNLASFNSSQLLGAPRLEQIFVAQERVIKRVFLFLVTSSGKREFEGTFDSRDASLELVDLRENVLASTKMPSASFGESGWQQEFVLPPAHLVKGHVYKIRLVTPPAVENQLRWFGSTKDNYPEGYAIVDGVKQDFDLTFRIGFARSSSAHAQ